MKKQYLQAILCTLPLLFAACDDNNEDSNSLDTLAEQNNVSSELSLDNGTTTSLQGYSSSSDETQPVYEYTQAFTNEDNSYEKSTEFSYSFVVDNKKIEIWAVYELLTDQPYATSISTYKSSTVNGTETWHPESRYFCSSLKRRACSNISLTLDQKTGNSTLNFNQAELYLSSGSNSEKIKLNGSITGLLAKLPTQPNPIMASSDYSLKYGLDNTNSAKPGTMPSHYQTLKFTNHNMNYFSTSYIPKDRSFFDENIDMGTHIYTTNDQVDYVRSVVSQLSGEFSLINVMFDKNANLATQTTYNPQTYVVSFNNTKFSSYDGSNPIYVTGDIGP